MTDDRPDDRPDDPIFGDPITGDPITENLRDLLRRRAATITAADLDDWHPPAAVGRWRRLAPLLAAAAAVVLVAAVLAAAIHDRTGGLGKGAANGAALGHTGSSTAGGTTAAGTSAVPKAPLPPAGQRGVVTLGLYVVVPAAWSVDAGCRTNVATPLNAFAVAPTASCAVFTGPRLTITSGAPSATNCPATNTHVVVNGRAECVVVLGADGYRMVVGAGSEGTTLELTHVTQTQALAVLRSVRSLFSEAPCTETPGAAGAADAGVLRGERAVTSCVYVAGGGAGTAYRLAGQAQLSGAGLADVLGALTDTARLETAIACRPDDVVIVLRTGSAARSVTLRLRGCAGQLVVGTGGRAVTAVAGDALTRLLTIG